MARSLGLVMPATTTDVDVGVSSGAEQGETVDATLTVADPAVDRVADRVRTSL